MTRLPENELREVLRLLEAGEELPPRYRQILFPSLEHLGHRPGVTAGEGEAERPPANILVVDDNVHNRELLSDHLEFQGHTVQTAVNGRDALDKMAEQSFDLVLLDIMMPEMDGYETLENLRKDPDLRHVPVVVLSAVNDMSSVVRCIELGAEDYLFKPFDATLLRARIFASLEKKRLRDQEQIYLQMLELEREKSDQLLLNILPRPIAERLKYAPDIIADTFAEVTVLFADIVDFTAVSADIEATQLIDLLSEVFSAFDRLVDDYGLEKIKTIGDEYMVVGGLPTPREDHAEVVADFALELINRIGGFTRPAGDPFRLRVGINTGPVVAGVIGSTKFSYDLWGDTVNTASRMQSQSLPNRVQVTEAVYLCLKDHYQFEPRGEIEVKGKGRMETYFLDGRL